MKKSLVLILTLGLISSHAHVSCAGAPEEESWSGYLQEIKEQLAEPFLEIWDDASEVRGDLHELFVDNSKEIYNDTKANIDITKNFVEEKKQQASNATHALYDNIKTKVKNKSRSTWAAITAWFHKEIW